MVLSFQSVGFCRWTKSERLTWGLPEVWLDGRKINSFTKPNFSPGRTSNFEIQFLISIKQLNRQRLSADGILIPHLRQALIVSGNAKNTSNEENIYLHFAIFYFNKYK